MNLKEFDSFRLADAISFHNELNPKLWRGNKLIPLVKDQLETIAQDFLEELGIHDLDVRDITISGSNAAYSYTPHSDLDLHILVNMSDLPQNEVYKELFNAKKTIYNDTHNITVHGVPVELYVQDANEPVKSLGEYSLMQDKWLRIPTKRRANFDQTATKAKYDKLLELVKTALKTKDSDKLNRILKKIKQYRQAGLDKGGEFGPENLAYKALRSQGYITKLYDLRDKLHSEKLSIESMYQEDYDPNGPPTGPEFKPTMPKGTVRVDVSDVYDWYKLGQHISNMKGLGKHDFGKGPPSTIMAFGDEDLEHQYIQALKKTGLSTTDIDPASHKKIKGQKVDPTYNVLDEAKMSIRSQIINDVQKNGPGEYFVRFTDSDKLGFSQKQMFGKTPDIGDTTFDVDNIGQNTGRRVLWFYPLSYYLKNYKDVYASEQPYVWLVKLKPNAWLQKVKRGDTKKLEAPSGKQRVGILRMSDPPAALFFSHGYDVIGKYQDYSKQHVPHGQVKGRPEPSFFDKVRGIDENSDEPKQASKSAIYSTDVYGMTAYHSKCLEPGCDWESKRYDSIKLAQNAAQKHAQKHFKKGVAEGNLNEIYKMPPTKNSSQGMTVWAYNDAIEKKSPVVYQKNNVVIFRANNDLLRYIVLQDNQPVLYIGFTKFLDGYKSGTVATEMAGRGKGLAQQAYLNASEILGVPIYSDSTQTDASRLGIWNKLIQQYPNRVVGYDQKSGSDLPLEITDQGPVVNQNQPIYVDRKSSKNNQLISPNDKSRTRLLKLLPNTQQGVAESASGYIPSNAQKNDPRFKTALTVDIKPDTMKKDAKKFGNKISRAGIPPTLKPSGKF